MRKGPGKILKGVTVTHTHSSWPVTDVRVSQASDAHRSIRHSNGLALKSGHPIGILDRPSRRGPGRRSCAVDCIQDITLPGVFPAAVRSVPLAAVLYARHSFNNPLYYTDPSGNVPIPDEDLPEKPIFSFDDEHGFCINYWNIGCSGGESYVNWWQNEYIPTLDEYVIEDIASAVQFVEDPLSLSVDAYDTWRGIPIPAKFGFGIDVFVQIAKDSVRDDLTEQQKFGRAIVSGAEGIVISGISTGVGKIVGDGLLTASFGIAAKTGQLWLPPVAFWAGFTSTYLATNYAVNSYVEEVVNPNLFPELGY
jgi:hypothetical protein